MLGFILGGLAATVVYSAMNPELRDKIFNYFDLRKK